MADNANINITPSLPQTSQNVEQPQRGVSLVVVIGALGVIVLLFGIVFLFSKLAPTGENKKSGSNNKSGTVVSNSINTPTPQPLPTLDPSIKCKRFTNIADALDYPGAACVLDLSNQDLSSLPDDITKLQKLNSINLSNNNFTTFPEQLTKMSGIMGINISNNKINELPTSISNLSKLQVLDASGNSISATEQEKIRQLFSKRTPPPTIKF